MGVFGGLAAVGVFGGLPGVLRTAFLGDASGDLESVFFGVVAAERDLEGDLADLVLDPGTACVRIACQ